MLIGFSAGFGTAEALPYLRSLRSLFLFRVLGHQVHGVAAD